MRVYFLGDGEYSFRDIGKNAPEYGQGWRVADTKQMPLRARRRARSGILQYPTETIDKFINSVNGKGVYFTPVSQSAANAMDDLGMNKIVKGPFIVYRLQQ